jgi:hypothetical protein
MMDPQSLYMQLGRLIETMPDLERSGEYSPEILKWLARAHALVSTQGNAQDIAGIRTATSNATLYYTGDLADQGPRKSAVKKIVTILYRALALAELDAPTTVRGAFIPAGNSFDAMAAVSRTLSGARHDALIVDPYMDEKALTDFAPLAPEGTIIRLLADQHSHKPTLRPAAERWKSQYGPKRPLVVKLAAGRVLHDRLIIADGTDVWILTQSLKDFAVRSPASIVRADGDAAALKISAYQDIWDSAASIA